LNAHHTPPQIVSISHGNGKQTGLVIVQKKSFVTARIAPVVTLYVSEISLQPSGGLTTSKSCPLQVVVGLDCEVVEAAAVLVAVPRYKVAAEVVYGNVVEQFPCRSSNCEIR
jgi:hypothetical protein